MLLHIIKHGVVLMCLGALSLASFMFFHSTGRMFYLLLTISLLGLGITLQIQWLEELKKIVSEGRVGNCLTIHSEV